MSLFGFVKDIGRKLFVNDDEAAGKIKAHIEGNNPGVTGLAVDYKDGIADLSGECDSAAAYEKCVLMAGNVKNVIDVHTAGLTIKNTKTVAAAEASDASKQQVPEQQVKVEFYTIKSGDSLSKIAKKYYGNAMEYPKIFEANREVIEDPDKIYPGQKIRIPMDS